MTQAPQDGSQRQSQLMLSPLGGAAPTILPASLDPEEQGGPWGVAGRTSPRLPGAAWPNVLKATSEADY